MVKMEKCGHEGGDGDASAVHSGELKESAVLGCDEGLGVEDEKDDWVSVGIVRKRGHRQTCSNGSSLADSDFVSLPDDGEAGDLDVEENISRRSTPTSGPGPGEFESDVPDWGPNPFVNHITIGSKTEAVKVVLMTLFVLPVRLIGITLFMFITWVLARLGVCGMTEMELKESPISGWRRDVRDVACITLRAMFLFGGFHWVTIKGKQASPKDAPILVVAPHSSFFDTLPVVVMGAPGLVAKGDIEKTFIFSSLLNFTQAIYVWREDPDSRLNTIKEIKRRMESSEPWPQLLIFPEGTCTNRQALITFKPGAFYPGLPVQPVCLRYPGERDYVSWTWKGATWFQAFWRTLTQIHTNCEIEFLPVYNPSETEKKDPVLFARNVRNVMARALEVPIVDYTFEDCRVMNAAEKCGLPCEVGLIQAYKLSRSLGMTTSDVIAEVRTFADFADMRTGLLSLDRFAKVLDLSLTPVEMMELLTLAGVPGHLDRLTFREYLMYKKQLMDLPRVDGKLKHLHGVLAKEVGGDSRIDGTSFRDLVDGESFSHLSVGDGAGDYDRFKASVIADSHLLDIIRGSISEQAGNTPSDR